MLLLNGSMINLPQCMTWRPWCYYKLLFMTICSAQIDVLQIWVILPVGTHLPCRVMGMGKSCTHRRAWVWVMGKVSGRRVRVWGGSTRAQTLWVPSLVGGCPKPLPVTQYDPVPPEHFRCLNTIVLYINLYLSTILRLLVMSVISSETLNNHQSPKHITHIIHIVIER